MIDREQAAAIVHEHARVRGRDFDRVVLLAEVRGREPLAWGVDLNRCWIAYLKMDGAPAHGASDVVAIDRSDGTVVYFGPANDEG